MAFAKRSRATHTPAMMFKWLLLLLSQPPTTPNHTQRFMEMALFFFFFFFFFCFFFVIIASRSVRFEKKKTTTLILSPLFLLIYICICSSWILYGIQLQCILPDSSFNWLISLKAKQNGKKIGATKDELYSLRTPRRRCFFFERNGNNLKRVTFQMDMTPFRFFCFFVFCFLFFVFFVERGLLFVSRISIQLARPYDESNQKTSFFSLLRQTGKSINLTSYLKEKNVNNKFDK